MDKDNKILELGGCLMSGTNIKGILMLKQRSGWISSILVAEVLLKSQNRYLPFSFLWSLSPNMQEQSRVRTIKVQPQLEEPLFYQPGDIVIGKCIDQPPWPAVVRSFRGYDEDQVQVFHVSFLGDRSSAYLETYLLAPLTERYIKKLKSKYMHHRWIYNALAIAQNKLKLLHEYCKDIPARYERFKRLYQPEKEIQTVLSEDVERFSFDRSYMHGRERNRELMPLIEKYYVDSQGNKRRSKEYVKRRLGIGSESLAVVVEIQEAERRGRQEYVITRISEGHVVNLFISKRAFDKNPNKKAGKSAQQQKQRLEDITYTHNLPQKRRTKQHSPSLQIQQTLLVSL